MNTRTALTLTLLLLTLALAGCAEQTGGDGPTICFSFHDLETEFWVASHRAITETLRGQGMTVIERNANEDVNKQLEQVRDCIAQGVDGILMIPNDGESANTIIREANRSGVPIALFNRGMTDRERQALVVVADNEEIAEATVAYMADQARKLGRPVTPLVMLGDLGDRNAVGRRQGFFNVIEQNPDLFNEPIEVPTRWDAPTALANLEAALQANPDVEFLFTSSDFLLPQIRAVLEPLGKWKPSGEDGHVILGALDGDQLACRLIREGYLDATGVQNLFFEADTLMNALTAAIEAGETTPEAWILDEGFPLTQENFADRSADTWGCRLLGEAGTAP